MFKEVPGYPEYKVNENSIIINKKGHPLQPTYNDNERPRVVLERYDDNGNLIARDNLFIYRVSAEAFLPNPNNYSLVMHLDNDTFHNHISNLKWGNQSENIQQAFDEGRKESPRCHDKYIFEVYNNDKSNTIRCKGTQGVADLLGFSSAKSVRPGIVKSGQYKGYTIENTGIKLKQPINFF